MNVVSNIYLELQKQGLILRQDQVKAIEQYLLILEQWNKVMNLTRLSIEDILSKVILEAFALNSFIEEKSKADMRVADIGTGAGIPGILLKIINNKLKLTLIDSQQKRCEFLREAVRVLRFADCSIVPHRVEVLSKNPLYKESFNYVVAKAIAPPVKALSLCMPLTARGGKVFISVGKSYIAEYKKKPIAGTSIEVKKVSSEKFYFLTFQKS